jgi:hypothetical protein
MNFKETTSFGLVVKFWDDYKLFNMSMKSLQLVITYMLYIPFHVQKSIFLKVLGLEGLDFADEYTVTWILNNHFYSVLLGMLWVRKFLNIKTFNDGNNIIFRV